MIAPTFFGAGTVQSGTGNISVPWPASHQVNDIGLLACETNGVSVSTPSGWNLLATDGSGSGVTGERLTVFWKRATSTSEANVTITAPGDHVLGRLIVIRGAENQGDPWDGSPNTGTAISDAVNGLINLLSISTTVADTLIVLFISNLVDTSSVRFSSLNISGGNMAGAVISTNNQITAGDGGGLACITGTCTAIGDIYSPGTHQITHATFNSLVAEIIVAIKPRQINCPSFVHNRAVNRAAFF